MTANGRSRARRQAGSRPSRPEPQTTFIAELWHFLRENKKWWLLPMIAALLLVGALIVFGGTSSVPFVYRLF
jgi:hypothetical protein